MKTSKWIVLIMVLLHSALVSFTQTIVYTEPDKTDSRTNNFEIIGKMQGNILVYKSVSSNGYIHLFDPNMKQIDKIKLDFLPSNYFNADFLQYPDFFYLFYQYQKKNIVFAMAAKFDAQGHTIGNPIQLDTTEINFSASEKIYTLLNSEDKQKLMVLKINTSNEKNHLLTTCLFDKNLSPIAKQQNAIGLPNTHSFLTQFQLDNDGNLVCLLASGSNQNDNINKLKLVVKPAASPNLVLNDIPLENIFLDDLKIKVDNFNKHYLVTSFFSKQKRGNIDGIYLYMHDVASQKSILNIPMVISNDLRAEAQRDASTKTALNDYFLRNVVIRKDGGFVIAAENVYSSNRGNNLNRWDYNGMPYNSGFGNYSFGSPYGGYYYPWNRFNNFNNTIRYFADNIMVLSFDVNGKMEWSNVIAKSQFDDNTDNYISYGVINTGDQVHFLFNAQDKRQMILTDQTINTEGQLVRKPTFRNLDKGYDFMPKQSKQTGLRQIIIPCEYRNYLCFAKIDF